MTCCVDTIPRDPKGEVAQWGEGCLLSKETIRAAPPEEPTARESRIVPSHLPIE